VKALIFGAGGQVGRALLATAPAGTDVVALDRARCDITCRSDVDRAVGEAQPDLVFNAAAFTSVDRAEGDETLAHALNAVAPGFIAGAARAAGARTIHISTDYVFDGESRRPYQPDDRPNPLSVYGRTKLAGERSVRQADPQSLTVRTMWLHSAGSGNFVTNMLGLMRERQQLSVVSDQIGTPTGARSLASALWALAGAGVTGLLHYREEGTASWHDFALAIEEHARMLGLLELPVPIVPIASADYPTAAPRPAFSVLDATEAWRIIGRPPQHWRAGVRRTLEEIGKAGLILP
jgi:dTDP-4-dehydrorhamnose reductase